jgi:hypothetical protein
MGTGQMLFGGKHHVWEFLDQNHEKQVSTTGCLLAMALVLHQYHFNRPLGRTHELYQYHGPVP